MRSSKGIKVFSIIRHVVQALKMSSLAFVGFSLRIERAKVFQLHLRGHISRALIFLNDGRLHYSFDVPKTDMENNRQINVLRTFG
jgi:hypothetical protein